MGRESILRVLRLKLEEIHLMGIFHHNEVRQHTCICDGKDHIDRLWISDLSL